VSVIEDYVRRGIDEGEIEPGNPRIIAYVLYKIFEAFSYASTMREEDFNREDILTLIPMWIMKGLAARKGAKRKKPTGKAS
jgi:hypothetical protein